MRQLTGAAITVALALTGCGSGGSKTVTVTSTSSAASNSSFSFSTTTPTTGGSTSDTVTTPSTTTTSTASTATVNLATFKSPSGNIGCTIVAGTARCDIRQRTWSPPPRPSSCPNIVDFGQGLIVGTSGSARFVCAGDTAADPSAAPLSYNTSTVADGFVCTSTSNGMTCTNMNSGHGFFIAIQGYRIF